MNAASAIMDMADLCRIYGVEMHLHITCRFDANARYYARITELGHDTVHVCESTSPAATPDDALIELYQRLPIALERKYPVIDKP
jgi:hypothetical protein